MKRALLGLAALAAAVGILLAATLAQRGTECEACMHYAGRRYCGRVTAARREEAERGAVANACGVLAAGVTAALECQRTAPLSLTCGE